MLAADPLGISARAEAAFRQTATLSWFAFAEARATYRAQIQAVAGLGVRW